MDIGKIIKSELESSMESKARCIRIAKLEVYWNDEKNVLVFIDKRKNHYHSHVVKVSLVTEDKMRRFSFKAISESISHLTSQIANKIHKASVLGGRGAGIRDPHTALDILLTFDDYQEESTQPFTIQEVHQFPDEGGLLGYVCDERLQLTTDRIYITDEMLLHHVVVTGTTGFGKSSLTISWHLKTSFLKYKK